MATFRQKDCLVEFGKVNKDELDQIDFTLPPDREETTRILAASQKGPTRFYVGCAKWGRKDWIGKIYPVNTKEADFLNHYGKHFNSIELNATFYRMPAKAMTSGWKDKVGPDFRFCPKFVNSITHIKRLKGTDEEVTRFLDGVSGFGETLGPILLMPHPGFGPKNLDVLDNFLGTLPSDIQVAVELRHHDWFADPDAFKNTFDVLEKHGALAAVTDAAGRRDCVHMRLTTPDAFIRFVGNDLHHTDYKRVDDWVNRIKGWMDQGIRTVYFFMHQTDEVHSPELVRYVIQQLNKVCKTTIPEPVFVPSNPEDTTGPVKKKRASSSRPRGGKTKQ